MTLSRRRLLQWLAAAPALATTPAFGWPTVPAPFEGFISAPRTVGGAGLGRVTIARPWPINHPDILGRLGGKTAWVSMDGNDDWDGTESRPLASIKEAFDRTHITRINVMPGVYEPAVRDGGLKRLYAPLGDVMIRQSGPDISIQKFAPLLGGRVWQSKLRLSKTRAVPQRLVLNIAGGDTLSLRSHASADDLFRAQGGWHFDADSSIMTIAIDDFEKSQHDMQALYSDGGADNGLEVRGGALLIDGNFHLFGVGVTGVRDHGSRPIVSMRGCRLSYTPGAAIRMVDGDSYLENVRVVASRFDALNYSWEEGRAARAIEVNCHATYSGDIDAFPLTLKNCNASSAHGGVDIARFGGLYERSNGPNIADTAEDEIESASWNVGVLTRSSFAGVGFGAYGAAKPRTCWNDRCQAEDERIGLQIGAGARAYSHQCEYGSVQAPSGAAN